MLGGENCFQFLYLLFRVPLVVMLPSLAPLAPTILPVPLYDQAVPGQCW